MPEVNYDALAQEHGGTAVADLPDYDSLAGEFGGEHVQPDSALGSFLRGAKANAASGIGGALGAAGAAALATPESAGLATIPAGFAGAMAGSALGEKAYKGLMGDQAYAREQAQLEANRLGGHSFAGGAGEMLPALLPAQGAGKFVKEGAGLLAKVGGTAEAGLRMGAAGEAKRQVDTGTLDPTALATHPIEEAVKFGPVGLIPAAKGILGTVMKAVPDAAVMQLSSDLYDHVAHDKPLSLAGYVDETGKSIPSFMLLNAISHVFHGAMPAPKPEGLSAEEMAAKGLVNTTPQPRPEVSGAKATAAEIAPIVPEVAATLDAKVDELQARKDGEDQAAKVEESIAASERARDQIDKEAKEREQQAKKAESETPATTAPTEPAGDQPETAEAPPAVAEPVAESEPITQQENATIQEPSTSGILSHPQEGASEAGGERIGVGQSEQGKETPKEGAPESKGRSGEGEQEAGARTRPEGQTAEHAPAQPSGEPASKSKEELGDVAPKFAKEPEEEDHIHVGKFVKVSARDANGRKFTFYAKPGKDSSFMGAKAKVFTEVTKDGNAVHDVGNKLANKTRIVQSSLIEKEEPLGMSKKYGEWQVVKPKVEPPKEEAPKYAKEKPTQSPVNLSEEGRQNLREEGRSTHEDEERVPQSDKEIEEWLKGKVKDDPDYLTKRIERALERPGEIRDTDVDVAARRWMDLEKVNDKLYGKLREKGISTEKRNSIIKDIEKNENEQSKAQRVAQASLSQFGRGLRSGRKMFNADFSVEGLTHRLEGSAGRKLNDKEKAFVDDLVEKNRKLKGELSLLRQKQKGAGLTFTHKVYRAISSMWNKRGKMADDAPDPRGKGKSVTDVRDMLAERGIRENPLIEVGNYGKAKDGKNWSMVVEDGKIKINASQIRDLDHFNETFTHEMGHLAEKDPEVVKHLGLLRDALTKTEKQKVKDWVERVDDKGEHLYSEAEKPSEEVAEILRILSGRPSAKAKLNSFIGKVSRVFQKVTGVRLGKVDAERLAAEVIARTEGAFKKEGAKYAKEGSRYAAEEGEGKDTTDFSKAQENAFYAENNLQAAVERAASISAAKNPDSAESFLKDFHELMGKNENFKDVPKEDLEDLLVQYGESKFSTRKKLVQEINKARSDQQGKDTKSPEYIKIENRIKALKARLAKGEFLKEPKEFHQLTEEEHELKLKEDDLKREVYAKTIEARRENRPLLKVASDGLSDSVNLARSVMTGLDFSAVLRQGIFPTLANPVRSLKILPKMFAAMRSEEAQNKVMSEIRRRPNAQWYEAGGLFLKDPTEAKPSAMEEAFMSRFAAKWPKALGGGLIRGSERAYVTFLNRLRADVFDQFASIAHPDGDLTASDAKAMANAANVFTGRGKIGLSDKTAAGLNTLFFAPRYVASVFNTMFGQPLYHGSGGVKRAVALEYGRFLAGAATLYALASMTLGNKDSIETDPRSSDFGKIKSDTARLNPLGGILQNTTLLSRVGSGQTKTQQGNIRSLRGPDKPYGGQSVWDVLSTYARMKFSPVVSAAVNTAAGSDVVGQPTDAGQEALKMITPMSLRDLYESMSADGVPKQTIYGILSLFGMGVNAYQPNASKK